MAAVSILSLALGGNEKQPRGKRAVAGPVRANLRKERRRRNTFRVGHIQTPQMPSCHNRLLPSALLLPTRRLSRPYSHKRLCLSPSSSSYSPTSLYRFPLFFFAIILPSQACPLLFSLLVLSRFFSHHALTPSLSLPCSLPRRLFFLPNSSHNGLIAPRGCLFK